MESRLNIDSSELFNLIPQPKVLVVDVRNNDELVTGRIPNSIHIPLSNLPIEYKRLIESNHVIFYCHTGVHSALAADYASSKGIKNVYNLRGGVLAWENAGYTFVEK